VNRPLSTWNPDVYLKFGGLRTRPAFELASRIGNLTPKKVYDLGCGPGNSTEILRAMFGGADIVGVDSSEEMLSEAGKSGPTGTTWLNKDLSNWVPEDRPDVIFSNATYQWIDDHAAIFPKLMQALGQGGSLAVQMPDNIDAPSHVLLRQVARQGPWADKVAHEIREAPVGAPRDYYDLLQPLSASLDIWTTEYAQVLNGEDPVLRWVSGTALRPFLTILEGEEQAQFVETYRQALRGAYPKSKDGATLFPFKRLFMVAVKK
jgi:trans-aconitate 2-methyltransferase